MCAGAAVMVALNSAFEVIAFGLQGKRITSQLLDVARIAIALQWPPGLLCCRGSLSGWDGRVSGWV
ncbi:hypothetical protein CGL27_43420 [Streptomyces sp. 11-1-2]|nr:hypothetical protein CGL27_43420 [Streptomyces sp. 11-1-2]